MKLNPPDLSPPVGMSEREHRATSHLNAVVFSFQYFVEGFSAAIELFKFCNSKPANIPRQLTWKWQWFALNGGAMQIWHLREAFNFVPRHVGPCAMVAKHLDEEKLEEAVALFDAHFPNFKLIRDAIAHASSVSLSTNKIVADDGLLAAPHIDGNTYSVVNKGKRYRLDMTEKSLSNLAEIVTVFWSAFAPVEKAFDQAGRSDE